MKAEKVNFMGSLGKKLTYRHMNLILIHYATKDFSRLCFTQVYFIETFVFDKAMM